MGYKRAIVLGNGESRRHVEIPDDCDVWACNHAYNENFKADFIVCADVNVQHEIYRSNYCKENACYFLDWDPLDSTDVDPGMFASTGALVDENEFTEHGLVVGSEHSKVYFTYLHEQDQVENVKFSDLFRPLSTGSLAMYIAANEWDYSEIMLSGFGDEKNIHNYEYNTPHVELWKEEREQVIKCFPHINWRYI